VENSFNNKKDVLAAFLDVSGAFDNVNIEILLQRLSVIGCPKNFIKFIKFLMSKRLIYTEDIESAPRLVHKGVPQGVLSSILYCIYVAEIVNNLPKSVGISQFADDIALWCNRRSMTSSRSILEKATNTIYNIYKR